MNTLAKYRAKNQTGFSLLEILVGVSIGLLGIVVIFQVLSVFEGRKRATGTGSDAQIAGNIAMFNLERDLKRAGDGFGMSGYTAVPPPNPPDPLHMGCTVTAYDSARATPAFTFFLRPIEIIDGAGGAPDQIRVLYGNATMRVDNVTYTASSSSIKKMESRNGLQLGELIVIHQLGSTQCALAEITRDVTATSPDDTLSIGHLAEGYTDYLGHVVASSRYNGGPAPAPPFTQGSVSNLGIAPHRDLWQVAGGKLRWQNDLQYVDDGTGQNTWFEVADGIVNLQAEYGIDANGNGMIESGEWTVTPPATDWTTVRAIRVALLARSQDYEKTAVTTTAPSWGPLPTLFIMTNVDGTADSSPGDANDWRHYRYRVYQTTIPLRNMIWGTAP